nr:uncharacterized protein LOC128688871 isoform X1 [Cherax quadricarinatus]
MNRVKKAEKFVDSIMVEDLDNQGRVTPVFVDEEDLTHDEFAQKRKDILKNPPKNYLEGEVEVITLDSSSPSTSQESQMEALHVIDERRKHAHKRKEEKRTAMRLEGIEEESPDRSVIQTQEQPQRTVLSPEEYEDYIGEAVEKDYPELAGRTDAELPLAVQQQDQQVKQEQQVLEQEPREEQPQQDETKHQPTGPLSGSASMNFMDDHSPTSNGNGDFYHRCVAKYPKDPPRQACGSFSVEAKYLLTSEVDRRNEICRNSTETNLLNNNESINSFATQFRTSCVASNYVSDNRKPMRTTSVSSSTSASANESRNNSTSASEHSSMSISTGSMSSNLSNVNKNRSNLFLPTSTTSLPEISIEPPTPQAPKPKDGFDRESKVKYDLRVPGYRSMFLTVPGFDDSDRYLPKYSFDSDDEEQSSSDDDVVHKPSVFASLAGIEESRGLKRYGSSCDIAKFGITTEEPTYSHEDDLNANFEISARKSKVGSTGIGPFVAGKLAVFEKVAEEEHQKFIECQEVRKRIFRTPKKSGEYIEKFYSPKVIETIDARGSVRSRNLRYYDDEYDDYNNHRSPTPTEMMTPYGGHSSPQNLSKHPPSINIYPSSDCNPERSHSPSPDYIAASYDNDDFEAYDYLGDRPRTATPMSEKRENSQVSPVPHSTTDHSNYWQSTEYRDIGLSQTSSPGPSTSQPLSTKDIIDQRTEEVLEMLDNSYSDMLPEDAGPSHYNTSAWQDEDDAGGAVAGYSGYETPEPPTRTMSPLPDRDHLDDVFDMEEYDSLGSPTSLGGGQKRKAAPPPPQPAGPSATPASDTKRGGFFGRTRRDKDKDREKEKDKEKKDKEKKEKKDKKKDKDKDGVPGKRFQLFGGAKKTSEPSSADEAPAKSPKKDKGKRSFFGRGRENFIGRTPHISLETDPQVTQKVEKEMAPTEKYRVRVSCLPETLAT